MERANGVLYGYVLTSEAPNNSVLVAYLENYYFTNGVKLNLYSSPADEYYFLIGELVGNQMYRNGQNANNAAAKVNSNVMKTVGTLANNPGSIYNSPEYMYYLSQQL